MGFLRGGLLTIVGIVLFIAFLAGNLFLTLYLSLDYDNVKPSFSSNIKDTIEEQFNIFDIITERMELITLYCENYSEYVFNQQGYTFVVPCDIILEGPEEIIIKTLDNFIENIYYRDYDCGFFDCLKKTGEPFFLVSKHAQDYWKAKFYSVLLIAVILVALSFLLIERKTNWPILVGGLLALSSLPFSKLSLWTSFMGTQYLEFFGIFFSKSRSVFIVSLVIGIVLIVLGIVLRFVAGDFLKQKFSKNEVIEIVNKEVKKSKQEEKEIKERNKKK